MKSARKIARIIINSFLGLFGLELIGKTNLFQYYIPFKKTVIGAKDAGLSVGDFIDSKYNISGTTQLTIDKMVELGIFVHKIDRICEIGPGSGRYLEKTIGVSNPTTYEIYETAKEWRDWLTQNYPIIAHNADGKTLSFTKTHTIDLVHSHKVFPGLDILTIMKYLTEMIRVVNQGGYIVFDVLSEDCIEEPYLHKWIESGVKWPCSMIPNHTIYDFFATRGFELVGDFFMPMAPGITHYFVFREHQT